MIPPLESGAEARALPAVKAAYAAARTSSRRGIPAERNHAILCEALTDAGVELGHHDHRAVLWLAGWEPEIVAAVAGWIGRANREDNSGG